MWGKNYQCENSNSRDQQYLWYTVNAIEHRQDREVKVTESDFTVLHVWGEKKVFVSVSLLEINGTTTWHKRLTPGIPTILNLQICWICTQLKAVSTVGFHEAREPKQTPYKH